MSRSDTPPIGEWREQCDDWPFWGDGGRRVELALKDGATLQGTLEIVDQTPGPDEIPLFEVVDDDGKHHSFVDHDKWRYLT